MDNCNEIVKGDPLRVLRLLACTSNHIHLLFCDLKSANPHPPLKKNLVLVFIFGGCLSIFNVYFLDF